MKSSRICCQAQTLLARIQEFHASSPQEKNILLQIEHLSKKKVKLLTKKLTCELQIASSIS